MTASAPVVPSPTAGLGSAATEALFTAYQLTTAAAIAVTEQPSLSLELVPTLTQTQDLARSHAVKWGGAYQTALLQPLTDVQGYTGTFISFTPHMDDLARRAGDGDAAAQAELRQGLTILRRLVSQNQAGVTTAKGEIEQFKQLVDDDRVRFGSDGKTLEKQYTGPGGEIAEIEKNLAALESELRETNQAIALGAAKAIPGALVLGIQLALAAEDIVGTGKAVIQTGITLARSTAAWDTEAIADSAVKFYGEAKKVPGIYQGVKKSVESPVLFESVTKAVEEAHAAMDRSAAGIARYRSELTKLTADRLQVGVFATLKGHVERLAAHVDQALTALDSTAQMWRQENDRIAYWDALAQGSSASQLEDELSGAAARWLLDAEAVRRYQRSLTDLPRS
ncbi:HBL/NHE enterotoxin family protein [Streptomyces sp. S186]|uniref:HBL/NHE enterotoxin family protein n=1 Tax=Streptomyces sp. S186 TaxID=3434395 RepID=UPI003F675B09